MGQPLRRYRFLVPYLLLAPGLIWLAVYYVYPAIQMFIASFWSGSLSQGYTFSLSNWTNYTEALDRYSEQFIRSIVYAALATLLTFPISFPLAYTIAFRGGRYKNLLLFLVIAPFFTSFLLRVISWRTILGDDGLLLGPLKDDRPAARRLPGPRHADRRHHRHHLQLPAVHDAADLRQPREDRPAPARGGPGPVRHARS